MLENVRVVDYSRLIPGAGVTQHLADHGADVVKLERPPVGDYLRTIPPLYRERGYFHLYMNRNKRSLAVDERTDEGREVVRRLVAEADVFVESNRPGATARAGLGYEELREVNPRLVYCSMTGFGQTGPYAGVASHGLNIDAFAGVLAVDRSGAKPVVADHYLSTGTIWGPVFAAMAIGFALVGAQRSGEGCYLDASCWDGAISYDFRHLLHTLNEGTAWPPYSSLGSRYDIYTTADGVDLMVCPIEQKFWENFCEAVGRPDLAGATAEDGAVDFGDPALTRELQEIVGGRTLEEWLDLIFERDLPISPVYDLGQATEDPHFAARDRVTTVEHSVVGPVKLLAPAVRGDRTYVERPAPELGEHSAEVLADLGYDAGAIEALRSQGTVVG